MECCHLQYTHRCGQPAPQFEDIFITLKRNSGRVSTYSPFPPAPPPTTYLHSSVTDSLPLDVLYPQNPMSAACGSGCFTESLVSSACRVSVFPFRDKSHSLLWADCFFNSLCTCFWKSCFVLKSICFEDSCLKSKVLGPEQ